MDEEPHADAKLRSGEGSGSTLNDGAAPYAGTFFSHSRNFTIAGGVFKSNTYIQHAPKPSPDHRKIQVGDSESDPMHLRQVDRLLRRMYSTRVSSVNSEIPVTAQQEDKEWRQLDISKYQAKDQTLAPSKFPIALLIFLGTLGLSTLLFFASKSASNELLNYYTPYALCSSDRSKIYTVDSNNGPTRVRNYIAADPGIHSNKSTYVLGEGWDQTVRRTNRWPMAADLNSDPVLRGRPIILRSKDCHALWVGSAESVLETVRVKGNRFELIDNAGYKLNWDMTQIDKFGGIWEAPNFETKVAEPSQENSGSTTIDKDSVIEKREIKNIVYNVSQANTSPLWPYTEKFEETNLGDHMTTNISHKFVYSVSEAGGVCAEAYHYEGIPTAPFQVGNPIFNGSDRGVSVGAITSASFTKAGESTKQVEREMVLSAHVPPRSKVVMVLTVQKAHMDVEFTYDEVLWFHDAKTKTVPGRHGIYKNVEAWNASCTVEVFPQ
ncbi:hypothetical protein C8R44DRAFT_883289 [Mycena epipterygia]|nr:hypothetical protein C8R44DRAFT_883289 [Mycena epipterygia]